MNSDQLKTWLDAAPAGVIVPNDIIQAAKAFDYVPAFWRFDSASDVWIKGAGG